MTTKNIEYENVCRICLESTSVFMNIFDEIDTDDGTIAEILMECTSVKILSNDEFSKLICTKCVENLKQTYAFVTQCQRSEQTLRKPRKKAYKCPYCPRKFRVLKYLQSHIMAERCKWWVKSGPKKCIVCNMEASRRWRFQRHLRQHFGQKRLKKISKRMEAKTTEEVKLEVEDHAVESAEFEQYVCTFCFETFNSEPDFTQHLEKHIKTETYFCSICETDVKTRIEFKQHLESHDVFVSDDESLEVNTEPQVIFKYQCRGCSKMFQTVSLLKNHVEKCDDYHCCLKKFPDKPDYLKQRQLHLGKKSTKCKLCGKILSTCSLQNHINLIHEKKKNHLCTFCGRAFGVKANLTVHMRIHTGEKPYECKECHQRFTQIQALYSHKISYHNENGVKHSCHICGRAFNRKETLKDHFNTHKTERSYQCKTCQKMFKTKRTLADHQVVHTGIREHVCSVCGKTFPRHKSLVVHLQSHSGVKPFKCLVCLREFSQKHLVLFHLNTHNVLKSELEKYFVKQPCS